VIGFGPSGLLSVISLTFGLAGYLLSNDFFERDYFYIRISTTENISGKNWKTMMMSISNASMGAVMADSNYRW
jgi:hypothetical protein